MSKYQASETISRHPMFDQEYYDCQREKGYCDEEILKFWDRDAKRQKNGNRLELNYPERKRHSLVFSQIVGMQKIIEKRIYDCQIAYLEHRTTPDEAAMWEAVRAQMIETLIPLYLDATTDEAAARAKIEAEIVR